MARVLIVDDDDGIRTSVRELLEAEGYEVADASDGEVALDRLRSQTERMVVLLDMVMPRMDGVEVLRVIADEPRLVERHAYILFTVSPERHLPADLLARLSVPVVEKPFDVDALLDVVARSAERLRSEQA
jgi:two-component system, NtrC family, response regulator HydG